MGIIMNNVITILIDAAPLLLKGAAMTLKLWLVTLVLSIIWGALFGIARCNRLRVRWLSGCLDAITFVLRGVPFYVQLLIAYFVVPDLLGINPPVFVIAAISLGLCSAAYASQIVRSGINAIPAGQWEACSMLGYTTKQTLWYVILPQMVRNILPALAGEADQLLKTTAIMSALGVLELTGAGRNIIARDMNPVTIYLAIAAIYLLMSSVLNYAAAQIEKRVSL